MKQKSKEWLVSSIIPIFNKEFRLNLSDRAVYEHTDINTRFYIAFKNQRVWKQIKNLFDIPDDTISWETPVFIHGVNKTLMRCYIQGYFDAEGGVPRSPAGSKLYLSFTQRNYESLDFIKNQLEMNWNITSGGLRISDKKSRSWRFSITGKPSIQKFISEIGTQHPSKKVRFSIISDLIE